MKIRKPLPYPSRRGAALIIALVAVMTVAMLGASYIQVTSSLVKRQTHSADQLRAFYAAEAGLSESFQAVRMGRSGEVGSEEEPALVGDGLVWVEVTELETGSIRLDSTGLVGSGRSALSLVVEPVDLNLGFFADDDMVIDNVIMVDGWNSDESTYGQAQEDLPAVTIGEGEYFYDNVELNVVLIHETFYDYSYRSGNTFYYRDSVPFGEIEWTADARLFFDSSKDGILWPMDPMLRQVASVDVQRMSLSTSSKTEISGAQPAADAANGAAAADGGAILGSNGNVSFQIPPDQSAEVWGELRPGPGGQVTGLENVEHSGAIVPRTAVVELPSVEIPEVTAEAPLRHEGLLPLFIPQGTSGYQSIEVAPDADLVIRGPAIVVMGDLLLEPGASLLLDTRDGDVSLYVTGDVDFQAGSLVTTTGIEPDQMTLQLSTSGAGAAGPTVNLDATSQFYGTIYAPETDVHVGSQFEMFGGIVARRLTVGHGARLHSDNSGYSGSPIPEILGWRTIEVPPAARGGGNPFLLMGVERATARPIATAHALGKVDLEIVFVDQVGTTRTFSGPEDSFDWSAVDTIVKAERKTTRDKEDALPGDEAEPAPAEEPTIEASPLVAEALGTQITDELRDTLLAMTPLSDSDLHAIVTARKMRSPELGDVLQAQRLEPALMLRLLNGDSTLTPVELKRTLLANTPLPDEVLEVVKIGTTSLPGNHRDEVLAAH